MKLYPQSRRSFSRISSSAGAKTVDNRAFVAFCGVATRGSRSRRLEHVVTAGLGVRTLSDACDAAQTKRLAALMFSLVGAEPSPAVERALSMYEDAGACARWCDRNAPGLADAYAAWARRRFLDDARPAPTIPAASGLLAPASVRACLLLSDVRTYGGLLRPLYASSKDGWSFQRLCREILGWAGPTLLVARAGARIFGVLADEAWRDDRKPFGAGGCRLYTFAPAFAVARPRAGQAGDLLYLNTKGSASVTKGLVVGGGAVHIPTELGDARIKVGRSLAFESLALVDDATVRRDGGWVDVDELEVWAAGDAGAGVSVPEPSGWTSSDEDEASGRSRAAAANAENPGPVHPRPPGSVTNTTKTFLASRATGFVPPGSVTHVPPAMSARDAEAARRAMLRDAEAAGAPDKARVVQMVKARLKPYYSHEKAHGSADDTGGATPGVSGERAGEKTETEGRAATDDRNRKRIRSAAQFKDLAKRASAAARAATAAAALKHGPDESADGAREEAIARAVRRAVDAALAREGIEVMKQLHESNNELSY